MYINCKTNFSFRYGTLTSKQLVTCAVERGIKSLALTNINNTCDLWNFVECCQQQNIKPVAGVEVRNENKLMYILLAANNNGLRSINHFLSIHIQQQILFPADLNEENACVDLHDIFIIYPLGKNPNRNLQVNEFIAVAPWELNKLFGLNLGEIKSKLVVRLPVTLMDNRVQSFNVHKLLRAIDRNVLLSKLSQDDLAAPGEYFVPPSDILEIFKRHSFIVTNTYRLMDACNLSIEFGVGKNRKFFSASTYDDRQMLRKLTYEGLQHRYGNSEPAIERVEKELDVIDKLGFNAYFLITADIIRYARSKSFYYVGRGSGANSVVAHCLGITNVDPIELDLYFERFLNSHRSSPPDFDIDFSWLDREEVIDYIFKKYGSNHVALLGSCATFQYNATIRELGKVFGLPKAEIDELGDAGRYYGPGRVKNTVNGDKQYNMHHLIAKYGTLITGFPNHLSVHAGGILISEEPIHQYSATFLPGKNFLTTQMDMYGAELIGLHKVDILSQRGLGHIKETIRLIRENKGEMVNIADVEKFKADPFVQEQFKKVNTIGCFYVESPSMRQLLKKLACENYLTLVAASSIIRPGVASSGMMKEYVFRYNNREKFQYAHPVMKELLQETFGVMVYQEDVIKVAHHFGGLDLSDADMLLRAMSGKYKNDNRFGLMREKFFTNCRCSGYSNELSREVWRQIESFGGYSFSKAHSASFAVESFQDLFLKAYYPLEFMVGVINNFGGFYSTQVYFYELIKAGASIHLPCVNTSQQLTIIRGKEVYAGLVHIKELEKNIAATILVERERNGEYLHLQDFIERTGITLDQLNILINIGAFRFTGKNKKQLLWEANFLQKKNKTHIPARNSLFNERPKTFVLPELHSDPVEDIYDEIEILGFPLRNPFELVDDNPGSYAAASCLPANAGSTMTLLGYLVTDKVVPTKNGQTMSFGTFIDNEFNWIDTIHFPDSLRQYPLQGKGFYRLSGRVVDDQGCFSVEVSAMKKIGYKQRKYANL